MVIGNLSASDFIWLSDGGGGVSGMRFRNSSSASYNNGAAGNNAFPDDGEWHHWALAADGAGSLTVYRDNVSLGTVSAVTTFNATHVGQAFNSDAQSMNGQIDELYIFGQALDAAEIGNLYNNVRDTTAPTLAAGDIIDDQGGGTVLVNSVVNYTVTFSEAIAAGTVNPDDFGSGGAAVSIVAISETAPGVFSVDVMPTSPGPLQLEVAAGASILDCWGNALDTTIAILDDTTLTVTSDNEPPTASGIGAANVRPFADLTLTFDEFVQAGSGSITIHLADGTVVATIDVTSDAVTIVDDTVTINPAGDLLPLTSYYVNIEAGAFEDLAGNSFAGITDATTWSFTTLGISLATIRSTPTSAMPPVPATTSSWRSAHRPLPPSPAIMSSEWGRSR